MIDTELADRIFEVYGRLPVTPLTAYEEREAEAAELMRDAKAERTDAGCVSCGGPTGLSNMALRCPPCKAKMKREASAAARQRKQREAA